MGPPLASQTVRLGRAFREEWAQAALRWGDRRSDWAGTLGLGFFMGKARGWGWVFSNNLPEQTFFHVQIQRPCSQAQFSDSPKVCEFQLREADRDVVNLRVTVIYGCCGNLVLGAMLVLSQSRHYALEWAVLVSNTRTHQRLQLPCLALGTMILFL